jgi:hypothetical protein
MFPIYRKMNSFKRYYKITDSNRFVEVSFIQNAPFIQEVKATKYPEKVRIQDMIDCNYDYTEMSDAEIKTYFENPIEGVKTISVSQKK